MNTPFLHDVRPADYPAYLPSCWSRMTVNERIVWVFKAAVARAEYTGDPMLQYIETHTLERLIGYRFRNAISEKVRPQLKEEGLTLVACTVEVAGKSVWVWHMVPYTRQKELDLSA